MKKIKVILADDHTILREGIKSLLEDEPDIDIVGEANNGHEVVKLAIKLNPDIVIIDLSMPLLNGLEATRKIKQSAPSIKIIILTMHDNEEYIRQALTAGALGYILKDAATHELLDAIRSINQGEAVLSPAITRLVIEDYLRWGDIKPKASEDGLSNREREILQLIAEGNTNKQISEILCLSIKTVQAHRANMMKKLDIHDRGELIKYAIQKKIIEI